MIKEIKTIYWKKKKKTSCNKRKASFEFIKIYIYKNVAKEWFADINAYQRLDKSLYTIDISVIQWFNFHGKRKWFQWRTNLKYAWLCIYQWTRMCVVFCKKNLQYLKIFNIDAFIAAWKYFKNLKWRNNCIAIILKLSFDVE